MLRALSENRFDTCEEHWEFEALNEALTLLIVKLKVLLAELHLELSQLGPGVIHVGALLINLFLDSRSVLDTDSIR